MQAFGGGVGVETIQHPKLNKMALNHLFMYHVNLRRSLSCVCITSSMYINTLVTGPNDLSNCTSTYLMCWMHSLESSFNSIFIYFWLTLTHLIIAKATCGMSTTTISHYDAIWHMIDIQLLSATPFSIMSTMY